MLRLIIASDFENMHSFSILTCNLVLKFAYAIYYNEGNSTDIFNVFKEKYSKVYKSAAEEKIRQKAFVKNLNVVDKLNEVTKDKKVFFILNQYADLDPKEIEDQFAIKLKPYHTVSNTEEAEFLGRQSNKEFNTSELYNLDDAVELYEDFMKIYKKQRMKKLNRTIHFYRFVKTLVEINKNHFEGNENVTIDETADVLKEPYEYFY